MDVRQTGWPRRPAEGEEPDAGGALPPRPFHQTYLSGVETGRRNTSIVVLERIAKALKVEMEVLVSKR